MRNGVVARSCFMLSIVLCVFVVIPVGGAAAAGDASAQTTVGNLLPGATASIENVSSSGTPTQILQIQLGSSQVATGLSNMAETFSLDQIGWLARLAATTVNQADPEVSGYQVLDSDGQSPSATVDALHGGFVSLNTELDMPLIDTVPASQGLAQLNSNLAVLQSSMPVGSIVSESAQALTVDSLANQYALEANITIGQSSDIANHYGDVIDGLSTGLVGNLALTSIEGLSVEVTTSAGAPVVGFWESTRSQYSVLQFADPSQATGTFETTTTYPDLDGGPPQVETVIGGHQSATKRVLSSVRTTPLTRSGSGDGTIWTVTLIALISLAILAIARWRKRRAVRI
jgi:hypothetical protein